MYDNNFSSVPKEILKCNRLLPAIGICEMGIQFPEYRFNSFLEDEDNFQDPFETCGPKNIFKINPKEFLSLAKRNKIKPGNTVSSFADWVYSIYAPNREKSGILRGMQAEKAIYQARQDLFQSQFIGRSYHRDWFLLYNGLNLKEDTNNKPRSFFSIPNLAIEGQPLRASPDLVFKNSETGEIIIIEIKFTDCQIPINLWPNIWAQLWAYSQIPDFSGASKITVIGEVWGENKYLEKYLHNQMNEADFFALNLDFEVYLRKIVKRNPRTPLFSEFFRNLFQIYSSGDRL